MSDLFNLLSAMSSMGSQPVSERTVARDSVDGFGISTVLSPDMGYETALGLTNGNWNPVERYGTRADATVGHARWLARVRGGERQFTMLGYGDLCDEETFTLS
mgnify:CR=1 FL=1